MSEPSYSNKNFGEINYQSHTHLASALSRPQTKDSKKSALIVQKINVPASNDGKKPSPKKKTFIPPPTQA